MPAVLIKIKNNCTYLFFLLENPILTCFILGIYQIPIVRKQKKKKQTNHIALIYDGLFYVYKSLYKMSKSTETREVFYKLMKDC